MNVSKCGQACHQIRNARTCIAGLLVEIKGSHFEVWQRVTAQLDRIGLAVLQCDAEQQSWTDTGEQGADGR